MFVPPSLSPRRSSLKSRIRFQPYGIVHEETETVTDLPTEAYLRSVDHHCYVTCVFLVNTFFSHRSQLLKFFFGDKDLLMHLLSRQKNHAQPNYNIYRVGSVDGIAAKVVVMPFLRHSASVQLSAVSAASHAALCTSSEFWQACSACSPHLPFLLKCSLSLV